MKKQLIYIMLCVMSVIAITSCDKMPVNGKLDGMWQLQEIQYTDGRATVYPEFTYFNVELQLIQLRGKGTYLGRFVYTGETLKIYDFRNGAGDEHEAVAGELKGYGISGTEEDYDIKTLTSSKMELQSKEAYLKFRKF